MRNFKKYSAEVKKQLHLMKRGAHKAKTFFQLFKKVYLEPLKKI